MQDHTPELPALKCCLDCKQEFPRTPAHFRRNKRTKDGLQCYCKACANLRFSNPEKKAEYDKQYRAANRDRLIARSKSYWSNNKEFIKERKKRYLEENRETFNRRQNERRRERYHSDPEYRAKYLEYRQAWRAAHPEAAQDYYARNSDKAKERTRNWEVANPERKRRRRAAWYQRTIGTRRDVQRVNAAAYRARKRGAAGTHTREDVTRQRKAQKGKCYYCGTKYGNTYHVDHVIPLVRGGSNGAENIVISCPTCNAAKGSKLPHEWDGTNKLL